MLACAVAIFIVVTSPDVIDICVVSSTTRGQGATGTVILLTQTTAWVFSAFLYATDHYYVKALFALLGLAIFVEVRPKLLGFSRNLKSCHVAGAAFLSQTGFSERATRRAKYPFARSCILCFLTPPSHALTLNLRSPGLHRSVWQQVAQPLYS